MDIYNTPAQTVTRRKWYEIWLDVWMHPGSEAFQSILNEEDHSSLRGYIWVGVTSLIIAILGSFSSSRYLNTLPQTVSYRFQEYACIIILVPLFSVLSVIITSGIYHGIARLLGGNGKWGDLALCLSAVAAPSLLIGGALSGIQLFFSQTLPLSCILAPLSFVISIYALVLYVNGIKAVEGFGTGQAVVTVFIPVIILILIGVCTALALVPLISQQIVQ